MTNQQEQPTRAKINVNIYSYTEKLSDHLNFFYIFAEYW
jgi:hypothetical protein